MLEIPESPFECKNCTSREFQNPYYPFLCTYCAEIIMYRDDEFSPDFNLENKLY